MKKIFILSLITIVFIGDLVSQAPNLMSYQAVIWDASGNLVSEKTVSIKISILQGSVSGTSVYSETHKIQTNINGLVSLTIGGGTNATGKISDINWGIGSFFLKTETDPTGGNSYTITGITQLVSVPYALHSNTSNNLNTPKPGLPGQILTVDKDGKPIWVSTLPTLSTNNSSNITSNTATSGGNVISDGGSPVTARGIVWSTFPNPTVSLSTITNNGSGLGIFSSTISGLILNTTYYARAYATNNVGTGYGNEISFTTKTDSTNVMGIPCPGTPTVKDIDGNTYNTVQIGTQCWTKENLKVTKYNDGTTIPLDTSGGVNGNGTGQIWSVRTTGARTVYGHNNNNLEVYGYLYNWYAVADIKGLCPRGWHVPSDTEWTTLTNYLGGENVAGGKMKSSGTTNWLSPNTEATNESGFSAIPGGYRTNDGIFPSIIFRAFFWSAAEYTDNSAWIRVLNDGTSEVDRYYIIKASGASVRCLRDSITTNPSQKPILTTNTLTSITQTGVTTGGNITSDSGLPITSRGVVWSTSPSPTISLSTKTSNGTGIGSFTSLLTNLTPKTTYYVRAYATNSAGTGYGNEISFTTKSDSTSVMGIPCPGTPTVKDIDGNIYNTVQIGTQCWTKENLKVSKYNDGTTIPLDTSGGTSGNGLTWSTRSTGARAVYANDNTNLASYGYLYNWYAVADIKGLCPSGWHAPSDREWTILTSYLGGESVAGGKMKSIGTTYWSSPNTGATNESGFSALPGGFRFIYGNFGQVRNSAIFWSATEDGINVAWYYVLWNNDSNIYRNYTTYYDKSTGASVRCLKDSITTNPSQKPVLTTNPLTSITQTGVTTGGNITSDSGLPITSRGVVWSTSPSPTISLSTKTSNGTGIGSFTSLLTNLIPKTIYYVRAYATNSAGNGYGNEISFTTKADSTSVMGIPCTGSPTVKDIDGNTYNTVQIGTQCWTKENLKVTKYNDGTTIPLDTSGGIGGNGTGQTWSTRSTGARTIYSNDNINLTTYGYLYNWYAVKGIVTEGSTNYKNLCLTGWHIPSDAEWTTLTNFLGGESVASGKMKSTGTTYWNSPNALATNESGFSALPGGFRNSDGSFTNIRNYAFFWSATEGDDNGAWFRNLNYDFGIVFRTRYTKTFGASVRCLRD